VLAGVLWAIGVLAEVVLFAVAGRRAGRVSPLIFVAMAGGAAALRWSLMATDPPWAATVALQTLHGLSFGACHLGAMFFIAGAFPPQLAGTAQALYGSLTAGVFMAAATASAGPLYRDIGAFAYLPMAAMGALGCAVALRMEVLRRAQPHSEGAGGETHAPP
jgi:PPP family 3-phenylpropionic acid transporter